jgi:hypothetical protein
MRTYYNNPRINASLMHEIRMIATSFFAGRNSKPVQKISPLKCNVCLGTQNMAEDAITIVDGQAVCMKHRTFTLKRNV